MNTTVELSRRMPHHPDAVWRALRDPRADYFGDLVNVRHEYLADDGTVQPGSRIILRPTAEATGRIPWILRGTIKPVSLVVASMDRDGRTREDVTLDSSLVEGGVTRTVEHSRRGSLVAIEVGLTMGGLVGILASRLPAGVTPADLAAREMAGMLDNLAVLAEEMATTRPDS